MTSKLFSWLYNFGLLLILSCSLPKILYRCCTQKKYFETIKLKLWPKILQPPQTQGHRIWIHAVSLGETKAIIELTLQLKKIYPDSYLIISSGTDTGHAEAKKSIPIADEHIYLPFDFSFIIQKLVAKIEPTLVLVCETDFWHNFLSFSKAIGAKIALVNGKISAKSYQRFKSLPLLKDKIFQHFDLFCLQNETYLSRFKQLQIDVAKLKVTGNMKFDTPLKLISKNEFRHELKIDHSADIILIASTHELEEELLLTTLKPLLSDLIVLLVPRHPYRYEKVANQLKNLNFSVIKYSEKKAVTKGQILLLDQMGLLQGAFQISQLTIMGGSFI